MNDVGEVSTVLSPEAKILLVDSAQERLPPGSNLKELGLSENCAVSHNPLVYQSPISQLGLSFGGYTPFSDTANWRQGLVKKLAEKLKPKNYMLTK